MLGNGPPVRKQPPPRARRSKAQRARRRKLDALASDLAFNPITSRVDSAREVVLRPQENAAMTASAKPIDPLRILYLAGPGDATSVLRSIAEGRPFDAVAHVAYSGQFFHVCQELGAHVLTLASNSRVDDFSFGNLRSKNIDNPLAGKGGVAYHAATVAHVADVMRQALAFDANVVIVSTEPDPYLFMPLALKGIAVLPTLHATLWREFGEQSRTQKLMAAVTAPLTRHLFRKTVPAIMSHPGATVRQVLEVSRGETRPIVEFLPLYRPDGFVDIPPPKWSPDQLRIVCVGRVEANKGVFDLVELARQLRADGRTGIRFDVCGTGSALEEARRRVKDLGLEASITLHGWTEMDDLRRLWGQSHLSVVPTTTDFVEGFNQVVVEATLAGRPVITSRVCPALDFVRACSIEVEVNDIAGYKRAILELADSRERYEALQAGCARSGAQFLDERKSFGTALRHVLAAMKEGRAVTPTAQPPVGAR
jgi:glycosyltransferase involved in cell wall biosynthesis